MYHVFLALLAELNLLMSWWSLLICGQIRIYVLGTPSVLHLKEQSTTHFAKPFKSLYTFSVQSLSLKLRFEFVTYQFCLCKKHTALFLMKQRDSWKILNTYVMPHTPNHYKPTVLDCIFQYHDQWSFMPCSIRLGRAVYKLQLYKFTCQSRSLFPQTKSPFLTDLLNYSFTDRTALLGIHLQTDWYPLSGICISSAHNGHCFYLPLY